MVGTDDQGNKYYKNKKDTKRWVIYNSIIESTLVNRNGTIGLDTLHYQNHQNSEKHDWQINHVQNLTGTDAPMTQKIVKKK